jgi:hypothetical protein
VHFEFLVGFLLRRQTPWESLFQRDAISGPAYYFSVLLFAAMPWLMYRFASSPVTPLKDPP